MTTSLDLYGDDSAIEALGGLPDQSQGSAPKPSSNALSTEKQVRFAQKIAQRGGILLPWNVLQNRRDLSNWIDQNAHLLQRGNSALSALPSSKQVQFAERIRRRREGAVHSITFMPMNPKLASGLGACVIPRQEHPTEWAHSEH